MVTIHASGNPSVELASPPGRAADAGRGIQYVQWRVRKLTGIFGFHILAVFAT